MFTHRVNGIDVYRFVLPYINSNMFVLLSGQSALVIDPHPSDVASQLFARHQTDNFLILLTHEHPDHTSGVNGLKQSASATLVCQQYCAQSIAVEKNNRPVLISFILAEHDKAHQTQLASEFNRTFTRYYCIADITFEQEYSSIWHGNNIQLFSTPGHSRGSCVIIINDTLLFSGDSLLKDVPVITRFPGGSLDDYKNKTLPFLQSLDKEMVCFPGHGDIFTLGDVLDDF